MKHSDQLSSENIHVSLSAPPSELLEDALEKSKSAVSQDCGDDDKLSVKLYQEAIGALQRVIDDDRDQINNKSRLKSIQESYLNRIQFLSNNSNEPLFKKATVTMGNNHKKTTITTKTKNSPLNIITSKTPIQPTKTAGTMLSSVFAINKRLSNQFSQPTEDKKPTQPRKPSFLNMKPSTSTPTNTNMIKRKNNNKINNGNNKNRYSWSSHIFSRNQAAAEETVSSATSPTLPAFKDFSTASSPVKQDYFDLNSVTHDEGTIKLFEKVPVDEPHLIDEQIASNSQRHSIDSDSTLSSNSKEIVTPPPHVLSLAASNSDSTANESESLSTLSEIIQQPIILEKDYELVSLDEQEVNTIVSSVTHSLHRSPSILTTNSSIHQIELVGSSNLGSELVHPIIEPSASTSSFQRSLLGKKKSSKKLPRNDSSKPPKINEESNLKSTFVNYLQSTAKLNKKVLPSSNTVELNRSKSKKKWSLTASGGKLPQFSNSAFVDPITFLSEPISTKIVCTADNNITNHRFKSDTIASIKLMNAILESMVNGGCITSNLHTPLDLWYQPNVRLLATDAKITACQLLLIVLEKMEKRKIFTDCIAIEDDLKMLEETLCEIKFTLVKKLGYIATGENENTPSLFEQSEATPSRYSRNFGPIISGSSGNKTSQTISTWSAKLSKSVERMKSEAARATYNTDQNDIYIKTLIKLFTSAKALETWKTKLALMIEDASCQKPLLYKRALSANERCISLLKMNICGFVLKDYEVLLDKWLKKSTEWMMD